MRKLTIRMIFKQLSNTEVIRVFQINFLVLWDRSHYIRIMEYMM